jgi:hypothetical protein
MLIRAADSGDRAGEIRLAAGIGPHRAAPTADSVQPPDAAQGRRLTTSLRSIDRDHDLPPRFDSFSR